MVDRDRVPAGPAQRGAVAAMPAGLIAFWASIVSIERSDGEVGTALTGALVASVVLGLLGMWVARLRPVALGAALGVAGGFGLALLIAAGLSATSP